MSRDAPPSRPAPAVSAVIVNYNAREHLLDCVRSLRTEGVDDIVVADNASSDGSAAALAASDPEVAFLSTGGNLGFGTGANRGAEATTGDFLLVLNPDVTVQPGTVKALAAVLEADDRVGIVAPRIENVDGTLYPSPRRFPSLLDAAGHAALGLVWPGNPFTRRYRMLDWDHCVASRAQWVSGSCFMARREAWDELGGFDESYFMYAEDVDLCWRAWRAGWAVVFEPAGRVVHVQGHSVDQRPYRMIVVHHRSLLRFASRSTTGWKRAALPLVAAGLTLRVPIALAHRLVAGRTRRRTVSVTERGGTVPRNHAAS